MACCFASRFVDFGIIRRWGLKPLSYRIPGNPLPVKGVSNPFSIAAGIQEKRWFHKVAGSDFRGRALVCGRSWWRFREFGGVREFVREIARDLLEGAELGSRHWFQDHFIAMPFDENFTSLEAESPRQADGLAASVSENFRSGHGYFLYLRGESVEARDSGLTYLNFCVGAKIETPRREDREGFRGE